MSQYSPPFADPAVQLPTREGYDRWAEIYDTDANPLVALEEPQMKAMLGDVRGVSVLDVGCGTGRHTSRLARDGAHVTAIDFSEGMLAQAKAKPECSAVEFRVHDLSKPMPFADHSFDRVICGLVVDHISDLQLLFTEMRRVCRRGGFGVISVMHPSMTLLGVQARFTDPASGKKMQCGSVENRMCDYVLAAVRSGWMISEMTEHSVDDAVVESIPRAARYKGWPMLLMLKLQ